MEKKNNDDNNFELQNMTSVGLEHIMFECHLSIPWM